MAQAHRRSTHKGFLVHIRWREHRAAGSSACLFSASYFVEDERESRWHDIADPLFHTFDTAAAFALDQARAVVNAMVGDAMPGDRRE